MRPWYEPPAAVRAGATFVQDTARARDDADTKHRDRKGQPAMKYPIDPFTPAVELAAAIRRKEVSPVEVAECYLDRIAEPDPRMEGRRDVRQRGAR
jgi:hypothetical protein